ncbi:ribosome-associated translation inhibitor RaiA [bacterium]|nr:ribosome-associated translation inhibitor RaiA [bacterium]
MDLRISARHMELTPEIREYAEKRIFPLSRYFDNILDTMLVLTAEKHRNQAELALSLSGKKFITKAETSDIFASIDEVSHKMERLLREHHDKLTDHKRAEFEEEKREFLTEMSQEM